MGLFLSLPPVQSSPPSPALCPGKLTSTSRPSPWLLKGPSDGRLERERERLGHLCPALPASTWRFWQQLVPSSPGSHPEVLLPGFPITGLS